MIFNFESVVKHIRSGAVVAIDGSVFCPFNISVTGTKAIIHWGLLVFRQPASPDEILQNCDSGPGFFDESIELLSSRKI